MRCSLSQEVVLMRIVKDVDRIICETLLTVPYLNDVSELYSDESWPV